MITFKLNTEQSIFHYSHETYLQPNLQNSTNDFEQQVTQMLFNFLKNIFTGATVAYSVKAPS